MSVRSLISASRRDKSNRAKESNSRRLKRILKQMLAEKLPSGPKGQLSNLIEASSNKDFWTRTLSVAQAHELNQSGKGEMTMAEYHPPLTGVEFRFEEEIAREAQKASRKQGLQRQRQNAKPSSREDSRHASARKSDSHLRAA
jgi:hypothetical protein